MVLKVDDNIDIDMLVNLEAKEDFIKYQVIDKAIADLFEAQRLMRAQDVDKAIGMLERVEEDVPHISVVPDLLGSAHYLKKNYKSALDNYKKAYRINPDNRDAYKMTNYLNKSLKVSKGKK